jgi:hypothetical protein
MLGNPCSNCGRYLAKNMVDLMKWYVSSSEHSKRQQSWMTQKAEIPERSGLKETQQKK